jgi:hypothetical protein
MELPIELLLGEVVFFCKPCLASKFTARARKCTYVAKYEHYTCEVHALRLFRRAVTAYVGQMQDARSARNDDSICMTIHAFVAHSLTAKKDLVSRESQPESGVSRIFRYLSIIGNFNRGISIRHETCKA